MKDSDIKNLFSNRASKLKTPEDEWDKIEAKINSHPFDLISKYLLSSGAIAVALLTVFVLNTNRELKQISEQEKNLTIDYITDGMDYSADELFGWIE